MAVRHQVIRTNRWVEGMRREKRREREEMAVRHQVIRTNRWVEGMRTDRCREREVDGC